MESCVELVEPWLEECLKDSSPLDLYIASSLGDCSAMKSALLRTPECINKANSGGWMPLMYAAYYGHVNALNLLLANSASVNVCTPSGLSPLMFAAMCGHSQIVKILIENGSLLELRDTKHMTALFHAISARDQSIVKILVDAGANVNACEQSEGETPLLLAIKHDVVSIVEVLLAAGADPNMPDSNNITPHDLARNLHLSEIKRLIASASIKVMGMKLKSPTELWDSFDASQHYRGVLESMLSDIGLGSYCELFREQEVNFHVFMTLSDSDLKECGVSKMGPRRKMTSLIARWHSKAPLRSSAETVYADKLEVELQQMKKKYEAVEEERERLESEKEYLTRKLVKARKLTTNTELLVVNARAKLHECHNIGSEISANILEIFKRVLIAKEGTTHSNSPEFSDKLAPNAPLEADPQQVVLPSDYRQRPPVFNVPNIGQMLKESYCKMRKLITLSNPNVSADVCCSKASDASTEVGGESLYSDSCSTASLSNISNGTIATLKAPQSYDSNDTVRTTPKLMYSPISEGGYYSLEENSPPLLPALNETHNKCKVINDAIDARKNKSVGYKQYDGIYRRDKYTNNDTLIDNNLSKMMAEKVKFVL